MRGVTRLSLICDKCDRCGRAFGGVARCMVDGIDRMAHARAAYCPHPDGPQFGDGKKSPAWYNAAHPPAPIPDGYTKEQEGGCGC